MKTILQWLALLAVVSITGCSTTLKTETHTTSTVIDQQPVVATDQEIKGH